MASRSQHPHYYLPGVSVTGWGPHRYTRSPKVTPAYVTVTFRRYEDGGPGLEITTELSPALAREVAAALISAADKAEASPLTHEHDDGPAAPSEVA